MKQKNKISLLIILLAAASMIVQSCGKDNMKYPSVTLKGRFTYNGQQVGLLHTSPDIISGNSNGATMGFQQIKGAQNVYGVNEVWVYTKHDATFTAKFFNGEYLARTIPSKAPFEDFDKRPVTVNGDTDLGNIEVVPYWWMTNLATTFTGGTGGATGVFTATFNVTKVSTNTLRTLQYVAVYLSPTDLPDVASASQGAIVSFNAGTNAGGIVVPAAASSGGAVTIKVDLSTLTTGQKQFLAAQGPGGHIWASVAVKTNGITDALYSDAIKLQ